MTIAHLLQPAKQPEIVQKTSRMTLWHKLDDQFWVPKAQVRVKIKSCVRIVHYIIQSCFHATTTFRAIAYATPRHAVHTRYALVMHSFTPSSDTPNRLLVDLLDDALSELTFAATLAGLSYDVTHEKAGVYLSVSGYSDKLPLLLRAVVDKLVEFEIKEDRVAVYKEQVRACQLENLRPWANVHVCIDREGVQELLPWSAERARAIFHVGCDQSQGLDTPTKTF